MAAAPSNARSGDPDDHGDSDLATPVLGDGFKELAHDGSSRAAGDAGWEGPTADAAADSAAERMRTLGLGQRKEERARVPNPLGVTSHPSPTFRSGSPSAAPPPRSASPKYLPGSPSRVPQTSPRVTSPTSSLIFERNVQEDVVPATASPAIPAHITTENHIPPILEEASKAITDDHLDPDSVEIVTHAAHLPAATVVTAGSDMPLTPLQPAPSMTSSIAAAAERDPSPQNSPPEAGGNWSALPTPVAHLGIMGSSPPHGSEAGIKPASEDGSSTFGAHLGNSASVPNYGSIADTTDVRRLSFISFADVVHAEQSVGGDATSIRDSAMASPVPAPSIGRSPSPLRSPTSPSLSAVSGAGSGNVAFGDMENSPGRARAGSASVGIGPSSLQSSALLHSIQGNSPPVGNTGGELTIETMRQALRKTGSGDLSASRSSVALGEGTEDAGR